MLNLFRVMSIFNEIQILTLSLFSFPLKFFFNQKVYLIQRTYNFLYLIRILIFEIVIYKIHLINLPTQ